MSDDVRELIAEVNELISEFEAIWGTGKRSENLRVMERLADALEATLQPTTITDEMVEKMAKELYVIFGEYDERQWRDASFVVKQTWRTCARAALEAALGGGNDA